MTTTEFDIATFPVRPAPANLFGLLPDARPPARRRLMEQALLWAAGLCLLAGFALFALPDLNQTLFLWINHGSAALPSELRALLTVLGDGNIAACLALAVLARNPRALACVFLAALVAGILVHLPKNLFEAARPPAVLALDAFELVGRGYRSNSFPSGHSATALLAATMLALVVKPRWLQLALLALGGLAGLSRAAVGVHWPSDILVGAAIGLVTGVLCFRLFAARPLLLPPWAEALLAFGIALVGVHSLMHDTDYEQFHGVTQLRWTAAALTLLVAAYWLAIVAWPLAEWLSRKVFAESAGQSLVRMFKFGVVGGSGFLVDITVYGLLSSWLGMDILLARSLAYWLTSSWNWYLNRVFTFRDADNGRKRVQWAKYLLMCLISFGPSMGTFYLLTESFEFFLQHSQLALVAGVLVGALFNYVVAGFLIFKVYGREPLESESR